MTEPAYITMFDGEGQEVWIPFDEAGEVRFNGLCEDEEDTSETPTPPSVSD